MEAPAQPPAPPPAPPAAAAPLRARVAAFLQQHYLPVSLACATAAGFLVPGPGIALARTPANAVSIVGIFFISGLQLQTAEVRKALAAWPAYAFGLLSILLLSPLTSLAIARLPTVPRELALGQALFMAMPTTVSSGAVLTGEARGNVALAILLSVASNVVGVFTVPLFLSGFLTRGGGDGGGSGGAFDPAELLWKLTLSILLPLGAGQALKAASRRVAGWVAAHKAALKYVSSALLVLIPWVVVSTSAAQLAAVPAGSFALLLLMAVAFHGALLAANYAVARALPVGLPERKALVINAAQKTINTALSVVQFLPASDALGLDKGLLLIPCLVSHFTQIVMDAYLASYWKKRVV
jgi:sodium/bile acid cotransporter 7